MSAVKKYSVILIVEKLLKFYILRDGITLDKHKRVQATILIEFWKCYPFLFGSKLYTFDINATFKHSSVDEEVCNYM